MQAPRRQPIGQVLGLVLRDFRGQLYRRAQHGGYEDIREAHLQVFGAIDWGGSRLSHLAARASMSPPAMAELVDDLETLGYVERRPDPRDGRAKLVVLTRKGRRAVAAARRAVEDIEREYAASVGPERFDALVVTLTALLDARSKAS